MTNLQSDVDFLSQVITLWLNKADDVERKGEPSWMSLVRGLRNKQVRQNGIANTIAKDNSITDVQSQGMLSYVCVCVCVYIYFFFSFITQ